MWAPPQSPLTRPSNAAARTTYCSFTGPDLMEDASSSATSDFVQLAEVSPDPGFRCA